MVAAKKLFTHLDEWFAERGYKRKGSQNPIFWFTNDQGMRCELYLISSTLGCNLGERHLGIVYRARIPKLAWLQRELLANSKFNAIPDASDAAAVAWETPVRDSQVSWKLLDWSDLFLPENQWDDRWRRLTDLWDESLPQLWGLLDQPDYRPVLEAHKEFQYPQESYYSKLLSDVHVGDVDGAVGRAEAFTPEDMITFQRPTNPGLWAAEEELAHVRATIADVAAGVLTKQTSTHGKAK